MTAEVIQPQSRRLEMAVNFNPTSAFLRHSEPKLAQKMEEIALLHELKNLGIAFTVRRSTSGLKFKVLLSNNLEMILSPVDKALDGSFEWFSFRIAAAGESANGNNLHESIRSFVSIRSIDKSLNNSLFEYTIHADSICEIIRLAVAGYRYFTGEEIIPLLKNSLRKYRSS